MQLTPLDWAVILAYFGMNLLIGLYCARRAKGSTSEFFLSGRDVPWWLAGTSMVATTFAADTPLAVTGMVAKNGIAGNWLWWSFAIGGMLTVFLYAKLWRRAGVMTDVEFAELRYSGRPAAFLRGFRALYLGIPINCIVMGWVNKAMMKILLTLGLTETQAYTSLLAVLLFTSFYTTISGLWGVLVTDLFQFVLKMGMVILLAVMAVRAVGGMGELQRKVEALDQAQGVHGSRLDFFPSFDSPWMPPLALFVYLGVIWWSSWYPGSEPGGGGYVAQRIFSAKDERHGVLATLWFNVAHYALRPWPWILTALAVLVLYPDLQDKESGYIRILMDPAVFPPALRGLMLAAFLAAYMSTIGTQLNWGASYVINDFYRRFLKPDGQERDYVRASQVTTMLLMGVSILVMRNLDSIAQAWKILLATGAGTGAVLLLRWFWWRINAWSEVSAMVAAAVSSILLQVVYGLDSDDPDQFAQLMVASVAITTVSWVAVTFLTPPEKPETLRHFYLTARPDGPGWVKPAREMGLPAPQFRPLMLQLADWVLGTTMIYAALFGSGKLLFGQPGLGGGLLLLSAVCAWLLARNLHTEDELRPTEEVPANSHTVTE